MRTIIYILPAVLALGMLGCARSAVDTTGFAVTDETTVQAPLAEAWQATKTVLREMELDIYTRDKRGRFVAFSDSERRWLFVPRRTQYTISLEENTAGVTNITIETVEQVYGVTPLTHPGWHDRKATDHAMAPEILEAVAAKL